MPGPHSCAVFQGKLPPEDPTGFTALPHSPLQRLFQILKTPPAYHNPHKRIIRSASITLQKGLHTSNHPQSTWSKSLMTSANPWVFQAMRFLRTCINNDPSHPQWANQCHWGSRKLPRPALLVDHSLKLHPSNIMAQKTSDQRKFFRSLYFQVTAFHSKKTHSLTANKSHRTETSQQRSLTATKSHSKETSQQRSHTAKKSHSKEVTQQRSFTAKKPHSKEVAQQRSLTAKKPRSKEVSQQRNLTVLQQRSLTAKKSHSEEVSQQRSVTAKKFHSKEVSQQRSFTAKKCHSKEVSQQRSLTAKTPHSQEVSQQVSPESFVFTFFNFLFLSDVSHESFVFTFFNFLLLSDVSHESFVFTSSAFSFWGTSCMKASVSHLHFLRGVLHESFVFTS